MTTLSTECPWFIEIRVEDPGHHRGARADVGRRDVLLGPDLVDDLRGVAARHPLELAERQRLRVADDAALGAAEGEVHQRALPRHPHRERLHLVERDAGVVADAALRRAARDVVRDAPAGEDADASRRPSSSGSRPRPTSCTRRGSPTRSSSIPKTSATFRSCCCAIRNGLSVRDAHGRQGGPTVSGRRPSPCSAVPRQRRAARRCGSRSSRRAATPPVGPRPVRPKR